MNVLFVIRGNNYYSSQQAQIELIFGLMKKNVNIHLVGETSKEVREEIEKKKIPFTPLFPKKKYDKIYAKELKTFVDKNHIEIVHFLDGKSLRSGFITLKNHPIKIVVYFGSVSLHWYDPSSYLTYLNPRIDKITCNSNFVYNHVKNQLKLKHRHKAIRIFKGYNSDWFDVIKPFNLEEFGISKNAIVVTFVGNHRKVKGTKFFLKSSYYLDSEKDIHYIVIGEKTDRGQLARIVKKSPISSKIHLLGKRNDVVSIMKSSHIYSQTSLKEGFGRAISEALAVGKPVVMTNAGGCTELIDESSGIITPLKDSKAIGKAISKLANDEVLRNEMGINAKRRIKNLYHIDSTVNDTLILYKDLLKN